VPTLLILHASQVVGDDLRRRGTAAPDLPTLYRYLYQFLHTTDCLSDSRFWATEDLASHVAVQYDESRDRCHVARGPEPVRWIEYVDAVRSDGSRFLRVIAADVATCDGWRQVGLGTLVGGRTETRQRHDPQDPTPESLAIGVVGSMSLSLNVSTYVMRTGNDEWERNTGPIPPATGRGPLVRHLNTPGTAEDFYREHQDLWRRIWEADTSGVQVGRLTDRTPLPSNRAITARPVEQTAPAPPPTYATPGEAVELDGPARSADDLDLHAERYRMIELD
jgi:hypothetical protein